jgi:methionyl-tRNA formyltransferase
MSVNPLNPESPRLIFLGHSCAASAVALADLLRGTNNSVAMDSDAVGTMHLQASPVFQADPPMMATCSLWPCGPPGDAGIAPTATAQQIVGVILAGSPGAFPGEPERLARAAGIPVFWVRTAAEVADVLRSMAPEVAVAVCFPWRLPRAARQVPPHGILNIHPSLLPAGRGPEPVFWTLRRGEPVTGVTVHRMDGGFDTGPIVVQAELAIMPGVRAPELENDLMALGARLLLEALPRLAAGTLPPQPQATHGVSKAPVPTAADWTMSPLLPAAWAWRFARGVAPLGGPLAVISGGALIPVADALDWSPDERLPEQVIEEADGTLRVRFSPGWVRFARRV